MTTSSQDCPAEVRAMIDQHLGQITRALSASDTPHAERGTIAHEVEQLIYESLAQRTQGQTPTAADARAVLAQLDPPDSYGQAPPQAGDQPRPARPRATPAGYASLGLSLAATAAVIAMMVHDNLREPILEHDTIELIAVLAMLGFAAALVCGLLAWRTTLGKAGSAYAAACLAFMLFVFLLDDADRVPAPPSIQVAPPTAPAADPDPMQSRSTPHEP